MTLNELSGPLELEIITGSPDTEITDGYTSDLLSDVMANAVEGSALITIQAHNNAVAVASHVDLPAIILCNSRPVTDDMLASAQEHGIVVCRSPLNQFTVSGILYSLLERPVPPGRPGTGQNDG